MSYATERQRAIEILGGKCSSCGETNPLVLEIDHKDGEGNYDRQIRTSFQILKDINNGVGVSMFQLLCANCHRVKHLISPFVGPEIHLGVAWKGQRGPKPSKLYAKHPRHPLDCTCPTCEAKLHKEFPDLFVS